MLKQKFILGYSSKLFIQFLQIAASIVVARVAGPTVLGTVAFGLAYVNMFKFISTLGLNHAHIKLISEGKDEGDCISTYVILKMGATVLFILVTLAFFLIQKYIYHVSFESKEHQIVIFIFLITLVIQSISDIPTNTFASKTQQAKQDIPNIIRNVFLQILRIVVVVIGFGAIALAFSQLLSFTLGAIMVFYLFRNYTWGKFNRQLAKQYILIATPMLIYGFSLGLIQSLDKVLLQFFSNSEQLGYYTAGFRIGGFVQIISYSISLLFFPLFSKAIANNDFDWIKEIINKFTKFSYLFLMPAIIFLAIYGDFIIRLILGNKYLSSINIFSIVIIAAFIELMTLPYANIITGKGLFKLIAKFGVLNLIVYVLILLAFIHPRMLNLGGFGAVLAFLISKIFAGSLYYFYAKKELPIVSEIINRKYILFGLINMVSFYFIYNYYKNINGIGFQISFILVYFVLTYLLLFILKWINKSDFAVMIDLFKIGKMRKYIKDELK